MKAELERLVELFDTWATEAKDHAERYAYSGDDASAYADCAHEARKLLTRSDWIPVSERLPDAITRVWATWARADGRENFVGMAYVNEDGSWFCWDTGDVMDTPLAWQPIEEPAPYRAEGADQ